MAEITIACPHCQQPIECPEEMLGEVAHCPRCNGRIQLPPPQTKRCSTPPIPPEIHQPQAIYSNSKVKQPSTCMKTAPSDFTSKKPLTRYMVAGALCFVCLIVAILTFTGQIETVPTSPYPTSRRVQEDKIVNDWRGSVKQVDTWLKENLKDPDSLQVIQWYKVIKTDDGNFAVKVKYRAKNGFGGYAVECKIFTLDSDGTVLRWSDCAN